MPTGPDLPRRGFIAGAAAAGAAGAMHPTRRARLRNARELVEMSDGPRPNFVILYTDDQGYGDLGCMGGRDLATPNLDSLAASGARFTDWYSNSPVCSPSRAAVLSGRYPVRAGVRSILAGHRQATGLPRTTPTIAEALRDVGYHTGMSGKWHLGVSEESRPHHHGFNDWFGFLAGCVDYYSHIFYWGGQDPVHDLWDNDAEVWRDGEYLTRLITSRAVDFIADAARRGDPFFLYVPYNAPHYPLHAPQEYLDRFPGLAWDRRIMAAMLAAVDDGVGEIVAALERRGLRDNTFVFFQSDNGPSRETRNWLDGTRDPYYGGTAGSLKGHKFSLYEGGIRMPAIMSWPRRIPAGQVIGQPGAAMDIFPTFLAAAGADASGYDLDGLDLLPTVRDGAPSPHDMLFWEQGDQTAVRQGDWKLVLNGQLVEGAPPQDAVHLANLADDPGERANLKDDQPAVCERLVAAATAWREQIDREWAERSAARPADTGHATRRG